MKNISVLSICIILSIIAIGCKKRFKEGNFKSYIETPLGIIGKKELLDINGKWYSKIKIEKNTTIVTQFDDKGEIYNSTSYTYGDDGFISKEVTTNKWGVVQSETTYEKKGDEYSLTTTYQGRNTNLECDCEVRKYKNSLLVESSYSKKGSPCSPQNGIAKTIYERYDDDKRFGSIKLIKYFDIEGKAIESNGIHATAYNVDNNDNTIDISYFGISGNPVLNKSGYHKTIYLHDEEDRAKEYYYLGIDKNPISDNNGVHKTVNEFKNGKLVSTRNYDENNKPTNESVNGIHQTKYKYDNQGNTIEVGRFDINDSPINLRNGIHKTLYTYDENNHLISTSYFSNSQSPVVDASGVHKYLYTNNKKNQTTSIAYFDSQGNPIKDSQDNVFMIKNKYDDLGRIISTSYWKNGSQKMNRWNGYHEDRKVYDEKTGQITEEIMLDENGNLYMEGEYSTRKNKYNEYGKLIELSYFKGAYPTTSTKASVSNFHKIAYKYDDEGYPIKEIRFFDVNGNPVNAIFSKIPGGKAHRVLFKYENYSLTEQQFFLIEDDTSPIKIQDCQTKPCLSSGGLAEIECWKY